MLIGIMICAQMTFIELHTIYCNLLAGTPAYMSPEVRLMTEARLAHPWAPDVYRCRPSWDCSFACLEVSDAKLCFCLFDAASCPKLAVGRNSK